MSPFKSLREYETFVYTLSQHFPSIIRSTLIVARRGSHLAELTGDLAFPGGHRLVMYERLSWDTGRQTIEGYSYEVLRANDKVYWYDSQPTRQIPNWPAPILIISMSRRTSNTTGSQHPSWVSRIPTSPF